MIEKIKMKSFKKIYKKKIYYDNNILKCWIEEEDPDYFKEIEIQIIKFSCTPVAIYMLKK